MSGFILVWFLQTLAFLITAFLIPRFTVEGPFSALKFVIVLSLINTTIWNGRLFAALPDSLTVHALSIVLANGVLFWILVKIMPGVSIDGVLPAIAGPIVFSVISALTFTYGKDVDWASVAQTAADEISGLRDTLLSGEEPAVKTKPAGKADGTSEDAHLSPRPAR